MMSKASDFTHLPVLYQQCLDHLAIKPDGIYVDCTLGGGGHSAGILARLSARGHLVAMDKDPEALKAAQLNLAQVDSAAALTLLHRDFSAIGDALSELGITQVDGILADLGVSSWQLDQAARGFGYGQDGPLDMRMNPTTGQTAADLVNRLPVEALTRILRDYGEERYARRLSEAIVRARTVSPIQTTTALADLIRQAMPGKGLQEKQHPARRTFQAIRIAVNQELAALEHLLAQAPALLKPAGRLCIITFHSLEDRIVKENFRTWENPCTCPRDFPVCTCGRKPSGHQVDRKGLTADADELNSNPRSRSARMRCFEKISGGDLS